MRASTGAITIHTGTARSGRSAAIDDAFIAQPDTALLLLPGRAGLRRREAELLSRAGWPGLWGRRMMDLAGFAEAIVAGPGGTVRRVSQLERGLLIERALQSEAEALSEILGIAPERLPRFAAHMLSVVMQLKQAAIEPADFLSRLERAGAVQPVDRAVALTYARYQELLKEADLFDVPGLYWAAEAACREQKPAVLAGVDLVLLDNFDDFTQSELRLIRAVCEQVPRVLIGLHHDNRPARSDAFALSAEALRALRQHLHATVTEHPEPEPVSEMDVVADYLFWRDAPPPDLKAPPALAIIPCIDSRHEAEEVTRQVRALLLDGVAPGRIAIAQRDGGAAGEILRAALREARVPVRGGQRVLLSATRTGAAIRQMVEAFEDWEREAVLALLVSPVLWDGAGDGSSDAIPMLTRKAMVLAGAEEWDRQLASLDAMLSSAAPERAKKILERVPAARETIVLMQERLGTLRTWEQAWRRDPLTLREIVDAWPAGESAARRALWALLDQVERHVAPGADMAGTILRAMEKVEVALPGAREGVLLTTPENLRHHEVEHLFVTGVNEGSYPRGPGLNAVYGRGEQQRLASADVKLETPAQHAARERLIFLRLFLEARAGVTLLWRVQKEQDREAAPSPFLAELAELLGHREGLRRPAPPAGAIIAKPSAVATLRDAVTAAAACGRAGKEAIAKRLPALARGMAVEAQRWEVAPCGAYDGMLSTPAALEMLSVRYGPRHVYSVQQLETWLSCPFHFFQQRIVRMDEQDSFEGELDPGDRGNLVHTILEDFHQRHQGRPLTEVPREQAEGWMAEAITAAFRAARGKVGLLPPETLRAEHTYISTRLARYLHQAYAREEDAHWAPRHFELKFGRGPDDAERGAQEQKLLAWPLQLQGEEVLLAGRIDRIDTQTTGNGLRIMDYKTGKVPRVMDINAGRDLQLVVYAMAAGDMLFPGTPCKAAYYVPVGKRETWREALGMDNASGKDLWPMRRENALQSIQRAINGMRSGTFPPLPAESACSGCKAGAKACRQQEARHARKIAGGNAEDKPRPQHTPNEI